MRRLFVLLLFNCLLYGSEPYGEKAITIFIPHRPSLELPPMSRLDSSDTATSDTTISEEDSLYDVAVNSFYPKGMKKQSATVALYTKRLIKAQSLTEKDEGESSPVLALRRKRDYGDEIEAAAQARVQALLLEAAHSALEDIEDELKKRERILEYKELQLAKKMSKRVSAAITTSVGALTTIVSGAIVYMLK